MYEFGIFGDKNCIKCAQNQSIYNHTLDKLNETL